MNSTGVVRNLDELGRITLPVELRRTLGITNRDPLEIFTDNDTVVLKKYEDGKKSCDMPCFAKDCKKNKDGKCQCIAYPTMDYVKINSKMHVECLDYVEDIRKKERFY